MRYFVTIFLFTAIIAAFSISCGNKSSQTENVIEAVPEDTTPEIIQIYAIEDAVIFENSPTKNMGKSDELLMNMNEEAGVNVNALIKFPLNQVTPLRDGDRVLLNVNFKKNSSYGTDHVGKQGIKIQSVANDWRAGSVTWSSKPAIKNDQAVLVSMDQFVNKNMSGIDITNIAKANDGNTLSILLSYNPPSGFAKTIFCSHEDSYKSCHPYISVERR